MKKRGVCLLLVLVCLMLTGCSVVREVLFSDRRDAVESAVAEELYAFSGTEPMQAERSDAVQAGQSAAQLMRNKVAWKIEESHRDYCIVVFTAPDMNAVLRDAADLLQQHPIRQSEYDAAVQAITEYICDCLREEDCPTVTTRVKVMLEDGEPVMTDEVYDAMYGGLFSALEQIETLYGGEA